MKHTLISFFLFFFLSFSVKSQKSIPSFGKIDLDNLRMKSCPFEPDAPAMKLLDIQETMFELFHYGGSRMKTEKRVRIKIFNEKGYEHTAIKIPFLNKRGLGRLKEISGVIYNLNESGKLVTTKLDKSDIFKHQVVDHIGMITFTFPGVGPGSVVEYRYTVVEKNVIQVDPWLIQGDIPVAYTSTHITIPSYSSLMVKVAGLDTLIPIRSMKGFSNTKQIFAYEQRDVPSFRPEPFMSSKRDNLRKAVFMLLPNSFGIIPTTLHSPAAWSLFGAMFLRDTTYGGQMTRFIPGSAPFINEALAIFPIEKRIGFIYDSVRRHMSGKEAQTMLAEDIREAWESRSGTSTEINLILLNILKRSDIEAYPLFISTRDNGRVNKSFPSIGQLNGMDVLVIDSGRRYILDASLRMHAMHYPPPNLLNRDAFVVSDSMHWITITDSRPLLKQGTTIFASMLPNGTIEGGATVQLYDYAKSEKLDTISTNPDAKKESFYDRNTAGLKILSTRRDFADDSFEPLMENIEFSYQPSQTGDYYFINPQFLAPWNPNPFVAEKRIYDIDLGANQEIITTLNLELPDSVEVDHLPENIVLRATDSSFFYKRSFDRQPGLVLMSEIFEIRKSVFPSEAYPGVQDFFKRMYVLFKQEIVLRKKK